MSKQKHSQDNDNDVFASSSGRSSKGELIEIRGASIDESNMDLVRIEGFGLENFPGDFSFTWTFLINKSIYQVLYQKATSLHLDEYKLKIKTMPLNIFKYNEGIGKRTHTLYIFLFYFYIYPPDSQESDGGANT